MASARGLLTTMLMGLPPIKGLTKRLSLQDLEIGKPQPGELPPCGRVKEIAVAHAGMPRWRRHRRTTQHHLINHELSIVFAERARGRTIGRIRSISAARPLPHDTERVLQFTV